MFHVQLCDLEQLSSLLIHTLHRIKMDRFFLKHPLALTTGGSNLHLPSASSDVRTLRKGPCPASTMVQAPDTSPSLQGPPPHSSSPPPSTSIMAVHGQGAERPSASIEGTRAWKIQRFVTNTAGKPGHTSYRSPHHDGNQNTSLTRKH